MQRRDFLYATSALALASVGGKRTFAKPATALPIVDTHQHLWDLELFKPPWLSGAPKVLASTHATKHYLQATEGLNVVKAVYMEVDVHPRDQVREARHVIELSKSDKHPTVAAVISGRPNDKGFAKYLTPLVKSGYVKGVRQVLHNENAKQGLCLQTQFVESMQFLGAKGLSFDLCMRPTELNDGAKLAKLCKDTRFIVDHCGNADPKAFLPKDKQSEKPWHEVDAWKKSMSQLASLPNVICKISGIIARVPGADWKADHLAPIINFCLDEFGPDRVVFGGDWPVCKLGGSYRQWVQALKAVISNRSETNQRKLLHDNAVRLYGLG